VGGAIILTGAEQMNRPADWWQTGPAQRPRLSGPRGSVSREIRSFGSLSLRLAAKPTESVVLRPPASTP
jgi:hypothetical protein